MIRELIDSLQDAARDRLRNPLPGAIICAWIALNWRVVVLLVKGAGPADEVINKIVAYGSLRLYLLPILVGFLYSLASPWITYKIEAWRATAVLAAKKARLDREKSFLEAKADLIERQAKNDDLRGQRRREADLDHARRQLELDYRQKQLEFEQESLRERLERERNEYHAKVEELDKREQRIGSAEVELVAKRKKHDASVSELADREREIAQGNQKLEAEQARVEVARVELEKTRQQVAEREREVAALEPRLAALQASLDVRAETLSKNEQSAGHVARDATSPKAILLPGECPSCGGYGWYPYYGYHSGRCDFAVD